MAQLPDSTTDLYAILVYATCSPKPFSLGLELCFRSRMLLFLLTHTGCFLARTPRNTDIEIGMVKASTLSASVQSRQSKPEADAQFQLLLTGQTSGRHLPVPIRPRLRSCSNALNVLG